MVGVSKGRGLLFRLLLRRPLLDTVFVDDSDGLAVVRHPRFLGSALLIAAFLAGFEGFFVID